MKLKFCTNSVDFEIKTCFAAVNEFVIGLEIRHLTLTPEVRWGAVITRFLPVLLG